MLIPNKLNGYARDGRREYHLDMGGGSQPQQSTTSAATVPEYARPYFEDLLGKTQAVTSTPLQQYQGERVAGFTPLQQQAFGTAGNMKTGPAAFAEQVPQYMSPYQQGVIDVSKRETTRQSDIQGQKQQAQATGAGAFGGYREAIERSERERNLGTQLGDIQTKGSQDAFDRATGAFTTGQQQTQDVAKTQAGMGSQQQGVQQQFLTQQHQDFINQQNAPYKQLGFMSDVLHGVPGTQSASNVYQAPPSPVSQVAGLGALAYGMSKKKGGVIDVEARYADGGPVGAGPNMYEMASMASEMTDEQLQQALKMHPNDPALQAEVQRRQRMRSSGLAMLPAAEMEYAGGGIVAFADGGVSQIPVGGYPPAPPAEEKAESTLGRWGRAILPDAEDIAFREQRGALLDEIAAQNTQPWEAITPTERKRREVRQQELKKQLEGLGSKPAVAKSTPEAGGGRGFVNPALADPDAPRPAPAKETAAEPQDTSGLAGLAVSRRIGTSFKPNTMKEATAEVDEALAGRNADTAEAFSPHHDMLRQEREEIDARKPANEKEGWITAGLGMLAGTSQHAGVNIGEGGIKGFKAFKDAEKAAAAAKKANTQAQMLAMQAERAERSGNLTGVTALYGHARQEKQKAAELELQAEQLRVQAYLANKTPTEIQIVERIAKENKISFTEAMKLRIGAQAEGKMGDTSKYTAWLNANPMMKYLPEEDQAAAYRRFLVTQQVPQATDTPAGKVRQ